MDPKVTFVVPCYNLAHLLPECIHSILNQTFEDFEILIMDDCSPDETPQVAQSFRDSRIKHIRNAHNLKHLANYNKGINLARGEYVWLISADDRLRQNDVLEKYIRIMDENIGLGYIFCPAMALRNNQEAEILKWSSFGDQDIMYKGRLFLLELLHSNRIASPCCLVRKECYKMELFPLDMPYAGDWYLWCIFALNYDVAYLGKPMVNYRIHEKSYTSYYQKDDIPDVIAEDEIKVRWRIMRKAESKGDEAIAKKCKDHIIDDYVMRINMKEEINHRQGLTYDNFEKSLRSNAKNKKEEKQIRATVLYGLANNHRQKKDLIEAISYYKKAIKERPIMWKAWIRYALSIVFSAGLSDKKGV